MKPFHISILVILTFCLVSLVCAAPSKTMTSNNISYLESGGSHNNTGRIGQTTSVTTSLNQVTGNDTVSSTVNFTQIPTMGKCLDNKKKIAVYMAATTNPVYSESTGKYVDTPVTYDPLTTAMFFEYNPDYLGDSNIASKLTTTNYELLIVPMSQMSTTAANAISTYIAKGGSVWFLNDPSKTPNGSSSVQLASVLGNGVSASIDNSSTITVINTDNITSGLPTSFKPVGTNTKTAEFRALSGSGKIDGLNYQVLMSSGSNALLVKFENQSTGARVIYSNPNMFISGGTSSYFDAKTATKLFTQTKAWIMKFAQNPSVLEITYPGSDKQLTVTIDDVECRIYDKHMTPMFDAETSVGINPIKVNTFYIIPNPDLNQSEVRYYEGYGDTHTIHPHQYYDNKTDSWYDSNWDVNSTSVATYDNNVSALKQFFNNAMNTGDYGFTSWRFPMTTYCANSMQAVSDESGFTTDPPLVNNDTSKPIGFKSELEQFITNAINKIDPGFTSWGFPITTSAASSIQKVSDNSSFNNSFTIDSSNGNAGDGFLVGNQEDNNIFFPEQVLVNNVKAKLIELELDSAFDIDCANGTEYYNGYNNYTSQFENVNFPANFIIAGHYQGIGMNGLSDWGVKATNLTDGLRRILVAEKAANPNYATINTLAKYINGVRSAQITANYNGTSTSITVKNTKPINSFTIKAGVGNVKSATCDGSAVTINTDSLTGASYIIKDLAAGTHVFVITQA